MQVRNLLIAAGAALAGVTAIAAVPATADAQVFRPGYRAEAFRIERVREIRRIEARRVWERERLAHLRFHRHFAYRPY
jgi:hypothetical protein